MEKKVIYFALAMSSILAIGCASASSKDGRFGIGSIIKRDGYNDPSSLTRYINRLSAQGQNWRQHGIYIETLDGADPIAMLNETAEFNPASVIKLSTTLAALDRLGPDHRFRTEFRIDGNINQKTGELNGNLIIVAGGDPSFSLSDTKKAGERLRAHGIKRINGSLVVIGKFSCNENSSTKTSANIFIRNAGIQFRRSPIFEYPDRYVPRGRSLFIVDSDNLLNIVQYLNAHSVNSMAETIASHIGGPKEVKQFLIDNIGMSEDSLYISRASGLEVNRMTPHDTVRMLRAMINWLASRDLNPAMVMPIAGIDAGTLRGRFGDGKFAGSVIGKTGTLTSTDSGVAALAGIMYTRERGPLLFAIYDIAAGAKLPALRRSQDEFLRQIITECGGPDSPRYRKGAKPPLKSSFVSAE